MPIYKGTNEVASGNLYKGTTEIQDGYKGTSSFYVNEVSISWLNFPGVTDYIITGSPGPTIGVSKSVSLTETAPGGSAYNGVQTASGVPADFSFTSGAQGSISNTTTSPSVGFNAAVFPAVSTSVDYNNLTVTLPTSVIETYSYSFTGSLASSTSCQAFSGSSCTVSSPTNYAGNFQYHNASASGTGGYGINACYQGCSVSISSTGGSSACNTVSGTTSQSGTIAMTCNVPQSDATVWGQYYCATVSTGSASEICGGYQIQTKTASGSWAGGGSASSSCTGTPTWLNPGNWNLIGYGGSSPVYDPARGTWESKIIDYSGSIVSSASCTVN